MTNTWWNRTTKDTTEIDENPLKLNEWHEKQQRSQYDRNDKIAVIPNDEKLIITLKSLSNWPSKSQHIINILTTQQNPMSEGKKSILKTYLKNLLSEPTNFLTIDKHLKSQTTKWITEITKTHRKPNKHIKKYKDHGMAEMTK